VVYYKINVFLSMAYLTTAVMFAYDIQIKNTLGMKKVQGQSEAAV